MMVVEKIKYDESLRSGTDKLNASIEQSNSAISEAGVAKNTANQAVSTSQEAVTKAESVQAQFNQVVIEGDSSVEAAQARVDAKNVAHPTLKARADSDYNEVTAQLADIMLNAFEYGISHLNTGLQNRIALQELVDKAQLESKRIYIPPLETGQNIEIEGTVIISGNKGIEIYGAGINSILKQMTRPTPIFIVRAPNTKIHDLHFTAFWRNLETAGEWIMDTRQAHHHCGVWFQSGSDGSETYNLYGTHIHILVNANAYNPNLDDYAGENIKNIKIENLIVDDVWCAAHVREVDNLSLKSIKGNYNYTGGYGGPPHLIYTAYVGTEDIPLRPLKNVVTQDIQAYGGVGGVAFGMKGILGGTATGLVAYNCEGLMEIEETELFEVVAPISDNDTQPFGRNGSTRITLSRKVKVKGGYTRFKRGNNATALVTSSTTSDCEIEHIYYTNHDAVNTATWKMDLNLQGVRNKYRVQTENLGEITGVGVYVQNSESVELEFPKVKFHRRSVYLDGTSKNTILRYRDEDLLPADTPGKQKVEIVNAATFFTPSMVPEKNILAYDDGDFSSGSSNIWNRLSSGQEVKSLTSSWVLDSQRLVRIVDNIPHGCCSFNVGYSNIDIEADIIVGEGNNGTGFILRSIDKDNHLVVEMGGGGSETGLRVGYRQNGSGVTLLNSVAQTYIKNKKYRLKVSLYNDNIQVFLDGQLKIEHTLSTELMATFGGAKDFGYRASGGANSRFSRLRIRKNY